MNKKDILNKIKSIDGLTPDERAYLVNLVNTKKKYGLVWEDKPEDVEEELRTKLPVLKEVKERAIINDTETEKHPNHILIEGDNLHALTALTFTHENKIDLIYIDPPYNTGSNDFRYNDNYIDKDDLFRHSKWLSFINKRLRIAKRLMKDDAVIFISINEEEYAQLKVLCDEIFGHQHYLTSFTIKVRHENRILKGDKDYHEVTEFLLLYRKSYDFKTVKRIEDNTSLDLYTYQIKELESPFSTETLDNKKVEIFKPDQYEIIRTDPSEDSLKKISIRGSIKEGNSSGRFFMKHLNDKIGKNLGYLFKVPNMGNDKFNYRYFQIPENAKRVNGDYFQGVPVNISDTKEVPYPNYFDFVDDFNNVGYEGGIEFRNGKKPINFLKKIIELSGKKEGFVLDFFAGSGSTFQACLEFNSENNRSINCIMSTNNEGEIANEVTYPRLKNVLNGYVDGRGNNINALKNNNLRYYQTAFVDREPSLGNKRQLTQLATELLCIKEDCYQEVTSQLNKASWKKCFTNGQGQYVYVIYDDMYIDDAVAALTAFVEKENPENRIKVYVFANGQYAYHEEFEELADNITLAALPDAIYKAYQNILPKENKEFVPELEEDIIDVEPKLDLN